MTEINNILFWVSVSTTAFILLKSIQQKTDYSTSWIPITIGILAASIIAYMYFPTYSGFAAGSLCLIFVIFPIISSRLEWRMYTKGDYVNSARLGRVIRWIHPIRNWSFWEAKNKAFYCMLHGKMEEAVHQIEQLEVTNSNAAFNKEWFILYLKRDWKNLVTLVENGSIEKYNYNVDYISQYIRAKGEIGDINGMLAMLDEYSSFIEKHPIYYTYCIFVATAFCGQVKFTKQILDTGKLNQLLDSDTRIIWLAVSEYAAGNNEAGQTLVKPFLNSQDCFLRIGAEKCTSGSIVLASQQLSQSSKELLTRFETEWITRNHLGKQILM